MNQTDWDNFHKMLARKADNWKHFLRVGDTHSWDLVNAYFASVIPKGVSHQLTAQEIRAVIKESAKLQRIKKRRERSRKDNQIARFWNPCRIAAAKAMAEERRDYLVKDL